MFLSEPALGPRGVIEVLNLVSSAGFAEIPRVPSLWANANHDLVRPVRPRAVDVGVADRRARIPRTMG